jgi:hypothetical protein
MNRNSLVRGAALVVTQTSLAKELFLECPNGEPGLDEMFADPIVKSLMSSDHVAPVDVERLLQSAKRQ